MRKGNHGERNESADGGKGAFLHAGDRFGGVAGRHGLTADSARFRHIRRGRETGAGIAASFTCCRGRHPVAPPPGRASLSSSVRPPMRLVIARTYAVAASALILFSLTWSVERACAQPTRAEGGVRFTLHAPDAGEVSLVGDFNGWSKDEDPMTRDSADIWSRTRPLRPGVWQYKFVLDRTVYRNDPSNPVTVVNYDNTGRNSVFVLTEEGSVALAASRPAPPANPADIYPPAPDRKTLYLNIIWHQHQPLYANPVTDRLAGPWVRTHATKDYYDMAAMLRNYPDIHCTINLTSSLLLQLQYYYVDRLAPYVDFHADTMDVRGFLARWRGKTDPWIDLLLKPVNRFTSEDKDFLYRNAWNAFSLSEVMRDRFPQYRALWEKLPREDVASDTLFTHQEMREIIFWFYLAHFDPDFLLGPVPLPNGAVCDLSGYVERKENNTFVLRRRITDADRRRILVETVKVLSSVIPVHRAMRYDPVQRTGQIEIITTPYYHPILPLIYDSDLARICQPRDSLPPRFSYPGDAAAHVAKAVPFFRSLFGAPPSGMWPGEGSVAREILPILHAHGIRWTASDVKVLERSEPRGRPNTSPYRFPAGDGSVALVFRDTELSDRIGFKYQSMDGEEAAEDFVRSILAMAPPEDGPDVLLTVILDGENAWEWYRRDLDGKTFLNALYRKLSRLSAMSRVRTVTPSEYLAGNPGRAVPPHPLESLPEMSHLWPGSWINANFDTWIGEPEENRAWEYLLGARRDLEATGLPRPDPSAPAPREHTQAWYTYKAWESMYAAEGSDWFWWYGSDQTAPGGESPFDSAFRTHLTNMYLYASRAGARLDTPVFPPITRTGPAGEATGLSGGTMARGTAAVRSVLFTCDTRGPSGQTPVFVAGNLEVLGSWVPNVVQLYDDGTHGDRVAGDGIWSLETEMPLGELIHYKYTRGGEPGSWEPGEEFPVRNRSFTVPAESGPPIVLHDVFGQ